MSSLTTPQCAVHYPPGNPLLTLLTLLTPNATRNTREVISGIASHLGLQKGITIAKETPLKRKSRSSANQTPKPATSPPVQVSLYASLVHHDRSSPSSPSALASRSSPTRSRWSVSLGSRSRRPGRLLSPVRTTPIRPLLGYWKGKARPRSPRASNRAGSDEASMQLGRWHHRYRGGRACGGGGRRWCESGATRKGSRGVVPCPVPRGAPRTPNHPHPTTHPIQLRDGLMTKPKRAFLLKAKLANDSIMDIFGHADLYLLLFKGPPRN